MMSDTNNSHENRGSAPNPTVNFSQARLPLLARVKKEPNYYDDPSLPSKFNFESYNFDSGFVYELYLINVQ